VGNFNNPPFNAWERSEKNPEKKIMLTEIIMFLLGIVTTVLFIESFFLIKCKKCGKKKPVFQIVRIKKWRQLVGQSCSDCQKKAQE